MIKMDNIIFTKRNEFGLHCRFCKENRHTIKNLNLYETSPIRGIVCENCKSHLQDYIWH
jgi:hypothetical protein